MLGDGVGHRLMDLPPPQRQLKLTHLQHAPEISDKFRGMTYKQVVKALHTATVANTLASYPPNRVLQRRPPDISKEEKLLPRPVRSELARLRSGFSRNLNSYMNRIDPSIADSCPACNSTPHDTNHLFNCNSNPTHLEPSALWTNPKQSALFLKLLQEVKEEDVKRPLL